MIPIYQSNSHYFDFSKGNKGLLFERLFNQYKLGDNSVMVEESAKTAFLKQIAKPSNNKVNFATYTLRQMALAAANQGSGKVYQLDGHLVTGMGNEHPVENGFLWHYTLGVPYLSGSQVKGLIRALIEQYYQDNDKKAVLKKWFGSADKKAVSTNVGELIFFDAIPTEMPTLCVDIMTPHMGDWYAKGGKITDINKDSDKIPADWHDPVPIPFLAVKKASFVFTIAKRANSDIDIDEVFDCLDKALTYCGAGAKTQTGYGFMSIANKETQNLAEVVDRAKQKVEESRKLAQAKANASALQAKLLDEIAKNNWRESSDTVKQHFTDSLKNEWLELLENNADDKNCIKLFFEIANIHYAKQMKNPNNKKVKPHQREWILRLLALIEE